MSIFSSYKKIFLLGFIITILVAIPFSVYVAQKRQQTVSKAAASTTLSFDPASPTIKVGDTLVLNIILNPGSNPNTANQVSFVKLSITFDASKFATVPGSLKANQDASNSLKNVVEDAMYQSGKASISLSIPADPTQAIVTTTKIATFTLKATSETAPTIPNITFDSPPNTQVLSLDNNSQTSDNVLSTSNPATVTINSAPAPSVTPTATPTPTPAPGSAPASAGIQNQTGRLSGQIPGSIPASSSSTIIIFNPTATPTSIPISGAGINDGLPPTGPGTQILGFGILGAAFTIIGGALFLLL